MDGQSYDAVVVGSGCAGAWAAKELAEAGVHTLVLEAGPAREPGDVPARVPPVPHRGWTVRTAHLDGAAPGPQPAHGTVHQARQPVQRTHPAYASRGPHLFVDDLERPYETPPDLPYHWIRGMQVGGRSLTWGGTSLRLSRYEFDAPSMDGCGLSWPVRYEELAPAYTVVEDVLGVGGTVEGLTQLPDSSYARDAYPLTPAEEDFRRAYRPGGTRPVPVRYVSGEGRDGWPSFTMQGTALAIAARTGRMTLRADATVTEVLVDPESGLATGVRYVDTVDATAHVVSARMVLLCAGTVETARLMLASRGPRHPHGVGNSGGWLGRGLMDHPVVAASGVLTDHPPVDGYEWSARQRGLVVPPAPGPPAGTAPEVRPFGLWVSLQRLVRDGQPWGSIVAQGEMLPYRHNGVSLGSATDRWGVPVPLIRCGYGPHEERLYAAMKHTIEQAAAVAGMKVVTMSEALTVPGLNVHELGTARMGADPRTSVVDADNRCWDCPNVLVTDGSCFPSGGWQNPTLTIMAISVRAARKAAALLREGQS